MPRRALLLSTLVAACAGEPQVEVLTRSSADTLQAQAWADRFELWFAQAAALADGELDAAVAELPIDEPELARAPKRKAKAAPPRESEATGPEEQELSDRVDAPGVEGQPVAPPTTAEELGAGDRGAARRAAPRPRAAGARAGGRAGVAVAGRARRAAGAADRPQGRLQGDALGDRRRRAEPLRALRTGVEEGPRPPRGQAVGGTGSPTCWPCRRARCRRCCGRSTATA
ncbi:hypothetical protein [Nannocystis pusilla]|uniref:hypothetical protein n=1 Tax=Nannocystis pusilla TaxID=889268 RepID=UPI003DA62D0E